MTASTQTSSTQTSSTQTAAMQAAHEAAVERAVGAMQEALIDTSPLDQIARISLYSRFHFHRTFRTVTGTTPGRFLACLRMQRAKELLAETELTVAAVGNLVGYGSLPTFTTQFSKLVGATPGRFRQLVVACDRAGRLGDVDGPRASTGCPRLAPVHWSAAAGTPPGPRTTIIGLFDSDVPSGMPSGFTMLDGAEGRIPTALNGSALAFSVPSDTRLVDLALGRCDGMLVGRAQAPRTGHPLALGLHRPRPGDPPIVSVAAVAHLVGSHGIRRAGAGARRTRSTLTASRQRPA